MMAVRFGQWALTVFLRSNRFILPSWKVTCIIFTNWLALKSSRISSNIWLLYLNRLVFCLLREFQREVKPSVPFISDVVQDSLIWCVEVTKVNEIDDQSFDFWFEFALIKLVCPQHVEQLLNSILQEDSCWGVISTKINRSFSNNSLLDSQSYFAKMASVKLISAPVKLGSFLWKIDA